MTNKRRHIGPAVQKLLSISSVLISASLKPYGNSAPVNRAATIRSPTKSKMGAPSPRPRACPEPKYLFEDVQIKRSTLLIVGDSGSTTCRGPSCLSVASKGERTINDHESAGPSIDPAQQVVDLIDAIKHREPLRFRVCVGRPRRSGHGQGRTHSRARRDKS